MRLLQSNILFRTINKSSIYILILFIKKYKEHLQKVTKNEKRIMERLKTKKKFYEKLTPKLLQGSFMELIRTMSDIIYFTTNFCAPTHEEL